MHVATQICHTDIAVLSQSPVISPITEAGEGSFLGQNRALCCWEEEKERGGAGIDWRPGRSLEPALVVP